MGSRSESAENDRTRHNASADRAAIARWEGEGGSTVRDDFLPATDARAPDERARSRRAR